MTNVLMTCAGRRNGLVESFRVAAMSHGGIVVAVDSSRDAAAFSSADRSYVVPSLSDPGYIDRLLLLCRDHRIGMVVSLNDYELPILSAARDRFRDMDVWPMVSDVNTIEICLDKIKTAEFLESQNIPGPKSWSSLDAVVHAVGVGEAVFPLVVKPRRGSGSVLVEIVHDLDELHAVWMLSERRLRRTFQGRMQDGALIAQIMLPGDEYGLDVVNDPAGNYVATFARRKTAMRAGETERAVTVVDAMFEDLGRRLGRSLRHVGNLDCDVFLHQGEIRVLELNPRFGGGYPFSQAAGADLPSVYLAWRNRTHVRPEWLTIQAGVAAAKYDRIAITNK